MKMGAEIWAQHVATAELETTSAAAYARRHGISVKGLYYWQRKLKAMPAVVRVGTSPAGKFVAVRIADTVIAQRSSDCTLVLASGMRLEMSALPAPEWLAALECAAQGAR